MPPHARTSPPRPADVSFGGDHKQRDVATAAPPSHGELWAEVERIAGNAQSVRLCRQRLQAGTGLPMAQLDSVCWSMGAVRCRPCVIGVDPNQVPCPVPSTCLGYQMEPGRMDAGWPLVLTANY